MSPVDSSAKSPPELDLLMGREPLTSRHFLAMALASIAVHIVAITFFLSLPEVIPVQRKSIITSDLHRAIHLTMPKEFQPTQKAPNLSKVVRSELDVRSQIETPQSQAPKYRPPQPPPGPIAATCSSARADPGHRAAQDSGRDRAADSDPSVHRPAAQPERLHAAGSSAAARV